MINIGAEDYNVLKQQYIKKYIRLELLDFQYNIVDELSGNMTKCSINVDSNSDLRRSCDLAFVVTTSTFDIKSGSKLWLDKFVRSYVGYENMRTGEIQWYNQGIYLVNNPQWSYDASTNEISMQALDLMSKLTGLRNGNLEGIPTVIAKDENVREAIISTLELGGFTKYVCEECKTNDGTIVPVPYDIEIDVGGTVYDVLAELRDIMPNYQIYFDVNGVFHYEPIPLAYDDPVLIDDNLWQYTLLSENINTDFESVKNYVEVLGHTWDVDYYSPSESTTVSGGTITPTFADLKELQQDTAVGITLPSDIDVSGGGGQLLPDGYKQFSYIQSTGTQYIDTGFSISSNNYNKIKFIVDCDIIGKGSGASDWLINGSNINNAYFYVGQYQSKYYYGCGTTDHNTNISVISGRHTFTLDTKNKKFSVSDVLEVSATTESVTATANLYLCGFAYTAQRSFAQKLYGSKIYQDDVLVRNFIPCKNSSGVIGLYDVVNSQFYSNAGTGEFTAGIEKEDLPSGYIQLEYIQSSGTQYIDTGFKPNQDTRLVATVDFSPATAWRWIFGGRQAASSNAFGFLSQENSKYRFDYGASTNSLSYEPTGYITIDINKNKCHINSTLASTATYTTFTSPVSCFLFGNNNNGTYTGGSTLKMYSCQIYDNNVLIRNFVPCKNSDGIIGMYDTTNNQFYQNLGTGEFVGGSELFPDSVDYKITINYLGKYGVVDIDDEVVKKLAKDIEWIFKAEADVEEPLLPSGYTQVEYIQSEGAQYIDTGFKPNQDTRVVGDMQFMSNTSDKESALFGYRVATNSQQYNFYQYNGTMRSPYNNSVGYTTTLSTDKISIDKNKNVTSVNGVVTSNVSYASFQCGGNMYLFGLNLNGSLSATQGSRRIYTCKIYDDDVLVRDFIPCKNSDGVIGMYDIVNSQFYQNSGSGEFVAGDEVGPVQNMKFWRFMGHQQAQATSYDNNPSSPFYVGDPIGSSSVGRIRIVLYGGEYDNIYSDDLAKQRADFEIYQRSRLNDSISMESIPIPWMDANIVISHKFGQKPEPSKYIVKSFSVDYATGGTMTINAISWYPYYEESEVV